ncbi:putative Dol-P-Glc:Glc(2)Man(9)GlcNAc(2)-PP-Dol alpha-1:2-glucosyltransferase-like protein, partial [Dinothrombium tinctorium]
IATVDRDGGRRSEETTPAVEAVVSTCLSRIAIVSSIGYISAILAVFVLVNEEVSVAYMDEQFHVKQARHYCVGNFTTWDPKITTPPGLYLITLGFLKPFSELYAFGEEDSAKICPLFMLRSMNVVFTVANTYLLYLISEQLHRYTPIIQSNFERSKRKTKFLKTIIISLPSILYLCFGYLIVGVMFLIFLAYNKGIVLGDRSAHSAVIHLSQVLYFLGFLSCFSFPWIYTKNNVKKFIAFILRNPSKITGITRFIYGGE